MWLLLKMEGIILQRTDDDVKQFDLKSKDLHIINDLIFMLYL